MARCCCFWCGLLLLLLLRNPHILNSSSGRLLLDVAGLLNRHAGGLEGTPWLQLARQLPPLQLRLRWRCGLLLLLLLGQQHPVSVDAVDST